MTEQLRPNSDSNSEPKQDKIAEAFNTDGYWIESWPLSSKKWVPGSNAGGILFTDIQELPMSAGEQFGNSKIGKALKHVVRIETESVKDAAPRQIDKDQHLIVKGDIEELGNRFERGREIVVFNRFRRPLHPKRGL